MATHEQEEAVTLFEDTQRTNTGPKPYSESLFSYCNQSARPEIQRMRALLEEWFARYPIEGQSSLYRRFRTDLTAAFYELFVHELLSCLGFSLTLHPDLSPRTSHRPDFLAENSTGEQFVVEATLATDQSDEERGLERVRNAVLDGINKLDSPDFMLDVDMVRWSSSTPSSNAIRAFLEDKLSKLSPDAVVERYEREGWKGIPEFHYSDEKDWLIIFRPIPVKPEKRRVSGRRPIGLLSVGGATWVKPAEALKTAIRKKATYYGTLDIPYIIAVNAVAEYLPDNEDLIDALIGEVRMQYRQSASGMYEAERGRLPDGAWIGPGGPINTRVSGVLFTIPVTPWNLPSAPVVLCLNPWAANSYKSGLTRLPHAIIRESNVEWVSGESLGEVLGLPEGWPHT